MASKVSSADIEFYASKRSSLYDALKKGFHFIEKPKHGKTGIVNQGATCYLNTLLQCLHSDSSFRNIIWSSTSDAPLIVALQHFLAQLETSEAASISSSSLITSFGWSKSQQFEQHDVHELFSVLIDALGRASSEVDHQVKELFCGQCMEAIKCPQCGYKKEHSSSFLTMPIDLPDGAVAQSARFADLYSTHLQAEVLDAENAWECGGCNIRVCAEKSVEYQQLPNKLFVHLKRFRFDPVTLRRRKLTSAVLFPRTFNFSQSSSDDDYNLTGVLIHTGTAMGGHYRAFLLNAETQSWFDYNDTVVTELSPQEADALFYISSEDGQSPRASHYRGLLHENAYMLVYSRLTGAPASLAPIPTYIASEVAAANELYGSLQKAYGIHEKLAELAVYVRCKVEPSLVGTSADYELMVDGCYISNVTYETYRVKISLHVDASMTVGFATERVFEAACACKLFSVEDVPLKNCRLRQYNDSSNRLGETFGDRTESSIASLGLSNSRAGTLLLETRLDTDPVFTEYNPREISVNFIQWSDIVSHYYPTAGNGCDVNYDELSVSLSAASAKLRQTDLAVDSTGGNASSSGVEPSITRKTVVVAGEDKATVGKLREEAYKAFGWDSTAVRVVLIHRSDRATVELSDDEKFLRREVGLWPGDEIIIEALPTVQNITESQSSAFACFKNAKKTIRLTVNNPLTEDPRALGPSYDDVVEVTAEQSVADLKAAIAGKLAIPADQPFYLRRSVTGAQLKDESKSLEDYALVDFSVVHVQLGKGCAVDEVLLHIDLDILGTSSAGDGIGIAAASSSTASSKKKSNSDYLSLGDLGVSESLSVLQLKQRIIDNWADLTGSSKVGLTAPKSAHHIRVRDGKVGQASSLLRDDRILVRVLLGLADGRRLILQVLDEPEVLTLDHVLLTVRTLSYEHKTMSRPIDLPVHRDCTVKQFLNKLIENYFPALLPTIPAQDTGTVVPAEASIIEIAKAFATGPPLTLKATSKLKWGDQSMFADGQASIDQSPLLLRDGSVVVVRGRQDYETAKAIAKTKKDAGGGGDADASNAGAQVNGPVGGGAAAVKAVKSSNIARIRAASSQGKRQGREQGITIEVLSGQSAHGTKTATVVATLADGGDPPNPPSSTEDKDLPPSPTKL